MTPIAVMARPGDMPRALNAPALQYIRLIESPAGWAQHQNGMVLLDNPMVQISSTALRENLNHRGTSQQVVKHIQQNHLYGF